MHPLGVYNQNLGYGAQTSDGAWGTAWSEKVDLKVGLQKKRKKFEKTITLGLDPVSSSQPRIKKLHLVNWSVFTPKVAPKSPFPSIMDT